MPNDLQEYVVVVTTCPDEELASRIATVLVERKLAACGADIERIGG